MNVLKEPYIQMLIVFTLVSFTGWIFVYGGISNLRKLKKQREEERIFTTGRVVEVVKAQKVYRTGRRFRRHNAVHTFWSPVVEFAVESHLYRLQAGYKTQEETLRVGETVDILYNENDPSRFHLKEQEERDKHAGRYFIVLGIIWIIISAVITPPMFR